MQEQDYFDRAGTTSQLAHSLAKHGAGDILARTHGIAWHAGGGEQVTAVDGSIGLGNIDPSPGYSTETIEQSLEALRNTLAPAVQGFDASNPAERDKGLGLVSISERARIIGGTVSVVSRPEQGTRVQATIPMHARVKLDVGAAMEGQVA